MRFAALNKNVRFLLLLCYTNAVMLCHSSSPSSTMSQTPLSFCLLYGAHRANRTYCSFTNQMLMGSLLLLHHRALPLKKKNQQHKIPCICLFFVLYKNLAATSHSAGCFQCNYNHVNSSRSPLADLSSMDVTVEGWYPPWRVWVLTFWKPSVDDHPSCLGIVDI